jgi:glyceraldehyde 3-phosphate dehydrogenase
LLKFDSQHGTWQPDVTSSNNEIHIDDRSVSYSENMDIKATPWSDLGIDIVVDCTGTFKTSSALQPYFDGNIQKVVVSAPVKDGPLNIVMGVNDHLYLSDTHHLVTAASCTTNCIAPVIKVIHEEFGIRHGAITTIHDITNSQSVLDQYQRDLRRSRASATSLIPTTTGSATAITEIFPDLKGKLSGVAVRVPVANASITDCGFEVETATSVDNVNAALQQAANKGALQGILGYEERPLVSVDYVGDVRSSVVDAPSTMVIEGTLIKILAWYDNEIGYVNRLMELAAKVAREM